MFRSLLLVFFLCISFNSFAEDFKKIPFSEAFLPKVAGSKDNNIPLMLTVPSDFNKHSASEEASTLWGTKEDIQLILSSRDLTKTQRGVFRIKVSLNTGYDTRTKKFSGEDEMVANAKKGGFSDIEFLKKEINGVPTATLTAVMDDRHVFLLYLALGEATLLVNYFHPESYSDTDSEIWESLIKGLAN